MNKLGSRGVLRVAARERTTPGRPARLERFLLGPTEDELKTAAALGSVVVINVSDYRCDALIIEKHGLRALQLPDLNSNDIRARVAALEKPEKQLLEWLWNTIGKPIPDALGLIHAPGGSLPRIWWVPTGPLTRFPIHAAGDHSCGSCNTVMDRVISSYSSSVRALIQSQQRRLRAKVVPKVNKAVLVGMEMTPGHSHHLQHVPEEVAKLNRLCRSMQLKVTTPQLRQDDVLSALKDCRIFHFAGHGFTHPSDPSKSSLILSDGLLTVASLFELNLHSHAIPCLSLGVRDQGDQARQTDGRGGSSDQCVPTCRFPTCERHIMDGRRPDVR